MAQQKWEGTTYGSGWMHRHLIRILRFTSVYFFYVFAALFIVPPCMIFHYGGRKSYAYFRTIHGFGRLKSLRHEYMNLYRFSQVVIDRFAMYAGQHFDVAVDGHDLFQSLAQREEGFIQLSSHAGNYELAGYSLNSGRKSINAVVFAGEKASVRENRQMMFGKTNINMIAITPDMGFIYEIDKALSEGNIVSFPSDRFQKGGRSITVPFMGKDAELPLGPFSVAAMRGLDVLAVNVMKTGAKKYTIYLKELEYDRNASRRQQIERLASEYAGELERVVRMYPDQWFNFYDFWKRS